MDAYGHVNNVQFLRLLEDARVALFSGPRYRGSVTDAASTGAGPDGAGPDGADHVVLLDGGLIVARAEIEYLRPLEYRLAPVAIDVWVSEIRGARFVLGYRVTDPEPGESPHELPEAGPWQQRPAVYAVAETTMVPYDLASKAPRRLLPDEVDVLKSWWDVPVTFRRRTGEARG